MTEDMHFEDESSWVLVPFTTKGTAEIKVNKSAQKTYFTCNLFKFDLFNLNSIKF